MSHQDKKSLSQIVVNFETLKRMIDWLLKPALFSGMQVRSGSKWKPRLLAATALLWAYSDYQCLTDRFAHVRKVAKKIFRWDNDPGDSYQGFIGMLKKWHARLLVAIVAELRLRMREELADQYLVGGFFLCAVDGSRVEVPRTQSNQKAYAAKKKPKKKRTAFGVAIDRYSQRQTSGLSGDQHHQQEILKRQTGG